MHVRTRALGVGFSFSGFTVVMFVHCLRMRRWTGDHLHWCTIGGEVGDDTRSLLCSVVFLKMPEDCAGSCASLQPATVYLVHCPQYRLPSFASY